MIFLYAGNVQGTPLGLWYQNLHGDIRAHSLWLLLVPLSLMVELTVLAHLFLRYPFSYVYHPYSPRALSVRSSLLALPFCTQMLAAALPVIHLGGLTSKTSTNFQSRNQKRVWGGEGIKHSDFLLPKLDLKILPVPASLCCFTASSKFLQLSCAPAPEAAVQPWNY